MKYRSGQTVLLMALSLAVSFGLLGFTVDLGASYYQKQKAQGAAESAALAAASYAQTNGATCGTNGIICNSTLTSCSSIASGTILYVGCQYANQNGFPMSLVSMAANLTSTTAPPCSNCGSPSYWIQASISTTNKNLFLGVANIANPAINVQAIAGVTSTGGGGGGGGGGCVYVLNASAAKAWSQSGGTFTTGCGVYVNSNNSTNAYFQNGGIDTFSGGSNLSIVGAKQTSGGIINFSGGGSTKTGQTSFANPVSGLTAPTPAGSCTADPNISGGNSNPIAAGTYCSLTISGGNGIVFSGTYIITTGNLKINGGNFSTAAGGATFYIPASNATGTIQISGGNGTFTAPSSGSLAGFSLWQNNSVAATVSGANVAVNGIIYTPNSALTFSGSNTAATMSIVTNTITMSGGNISQPAESSFFSNGAAATISAGYLIQ